MVHQNEGVSLRIQEVGGNNLVNRTQQETK